MNAQVFVPTQIDLFLSLLESNLMLSLIFKISLTNFHRISTAGGTTLLLLCCCRPIRSSTTQHEVHGAVIPNKPALGLGNEAHAAGGVVEQAEAALDVVDADLAGLSLGGDELGRGEQVAGVAEAGLLADLGEEGEGVGGAVDLLLLGADGQDVADVVGAVGLGLDDDDAVEEVEGQAVRAPVVRAADLGVAPVRRHDDDGRQVDLERPVDVAEALDVEHVDLVDEEDAGDDLRFPFLLPLPDLGVDLVPDLAADLARVAAEEGQEALGPRVDDVDLVQGDGVDDLAALLELAVGALQELGVGAHGVVVAGAGVGAAQLGDLAAALVDGDDVAGDDALPRHGVDHLGAHVVDRLHVRRLDRELALLGAPRHAPVDLDLHHLALHHLRLLLDPHPDRLPERLRQRLRLGHLEREDLRRRERREGDVGPERLRHPHCYGCLSGTVLREGEGSTQLAMPRAT